MYANTPQDVLERMFWQLVRMNTQNMEEELRRIRQLDAVSEELDRREGRE